MPYPALSSSNVERLPRVPGDFNLVFLKDAQPAPQDVLLEQAFTKTGNWGVNDSSIQDYARAQFFRSFPGNSLIDIIDECIGLDEQNVGMDVMGGDNGVALRDLLASGTLGKAILTSLIDSRDKENRDERLHHVAGDILEPFTWQDMRQKQLELAPDGLALIMHRPFGAVQHQPMNVYEGGAHALLDMLRPGGLMFLQRPQTVRLARGNTQILRSLYARGDIGRIVLSDPYKVRVGRGAIAALIFKK